MLGCILECCQYIRPKDVLNYLVEDGYLFILAVFQIHQYTMNHEMLLPTEANTKMPLQLCFSFGASIVCSSHKASFF